MPHGSISLGPGHVSGERFWEILTSKGHVGPSASRRRRLRRLSYLVRRTVAAEVRMSSPSDGRSTAPGEHAAKRAGSEAKGTPRNTATSPLHEPWSSPSDTRVLGSIKTSSSSLSTTLNMYHVIHVESVRRGLRFHPASLDSPGRRHLVAGTAEHLHVRHPGRGRGPRRGGSPPI